MIHSLASNIALFFATNHQIKLEEKEVYVYGMEFVISTVVNFFIILLISVCIGRLWESIAYVSGFILLRRYIGGYHATTHMNCFLTFLFVYSANMLVVLFLKNSDNRIISILLVSIVLILVFLQKPVTNRNKHITSVDYCDYILKSRILMLLINLIVIVGNLVSKNSVVLLSLGLGTMTAVLSAIIAKSIERRLSIV